MFTLLLEKVHSNSLRRRTRRDTQSHPDYRSGVSLGRNRAGGENRSL